MAWNKWYSDYKYQEISGDEKMAASIPLILLSTNVGAINTVLM